MPTLQALAAQITDAFSGRVDHTVFGQAAGAVPYGEVVEVMHVAKGAGAQRIGIPNER